MEKSELQFLNECLLDELLLPFLLAENNGLFAANVASSEAKTTTDVLSVLNYNVLTVDFFDNQSARIVFE